jgi:hypothetical protein
MTSDCATTFAGRCSIAEKAFPYIVSLIHSPHISRARPAALVCGVARSLPCRAPFNRSFGLGDFSWPVDTKLALAGAAITTEGPGANGDPPP